MDVVEAIKTRKSVRGFKPDPVPNETLKEILEISTRAASGMNTQPWEIAVITGKTLENIKKGNVEMLSSGAALTSALSEGPFEGVYRQRQVDLGMQIFELMGITREDKEKRAEWGQRGFRFFDAPAAFILYIDESLSKPMAVFGIGCLTQAICLTALNCGLGTCIEAQGSGFPEVVKKYANIPDSKILVVSIAIGYPDWDFPANKLVSPREPLENIVSWCD